MKKKMVLSGVGSTSSTPTREVTSNGKMEAVRPLGLKSEKILHDMVRKRKTKAK